MHIVQVRSARRNDLRTGYAPVKARLHHGASSENSDPFKTALFDGPAHFGNHIDNGKWRYRLESINAKMSAERCDTDTFGPCRNKAVRESRVYGSLRGCVIAGEIAQKRWRVGMHNRQLQC